MRIAITLKYLEGFEKNLFTNGLYQNIFTLYKIIEKIGYEPYICIGLNNGKDFKKELLEFGFKSFPFESKEFKKHKIDLLIEAGTVCDTLVNIEKLVPNIKKVALLYGNPYFPRIENILFKKDFGSSYMYYKRDEIWISPHFEFSKHFVKAITNVNDVKIAPFVWTPKYVEKRLADKGMTKEEFTKNLPSPNKVAILEPNINIVKTSIIPTFISERLYNEHPELIDYVMCFGSTEYTKSKTAQMLFSPANIVRDKKMSFEARYAFDSIFRNFCGSILSNQHFNELNYVYLEALHFEIPLIHNSTFFKDVGYYYDEANVEEGKEKLKEAILTHKYRSEEKRNKEKEAVNKYLDTNPDNINGYKKLIDGVFK